jgi:putative ABC transport system substrate-binding protein
MRSGILKAVLAALLLAPCLALAQAKPGKAVRIGVLSPATPTALASRIDAFRQALAAQGYREGQNLRIDYRWGEGQDERLATLAGELAQLDVDVLVVHGVQAALAASGTGRVIPTVCLVCGELLGTGLVDSLAKPGGNLTGMTSINPTTSGKRLALLREAVRGLKKVALMWNPRNPVAIPEVKETEAAARSLGIGVQSLAVADASAFENAFAAMAKEGVQGLVLISDATFVGRRKEIAALAVKHRIPAIAWTAELAVAGLLMSYGPDPVAMSQRAADFVVRILKGAKPADLPVEQPTKFEFLVNLKTASALGLTLPQSLRLRADQTIR